MTTFVSGSGLAAGLVLLALAPAVLAALISACITWQSMPLLQRYALARPNARSSHKIPTPQGAGIAVVAATLLVAVPWAAWTYGALPSSLIGSAVLIALVGLVDDIKNYLAATLLRTGRDSLSEIVGADAATITAEDWPIS